MSRIFNAADFNSIAEHIEKGHAVFTHDNGRLLPKMLRQAAIQADEMRELNEVMSLKEPTPMLVPTRENHERGCLHRYGAPGADCNCPGREVYLSAKPPLLISIDDVLAAGNSPFHRREA